MKTFRWLVTLAAAILWLPAIGAAQSGTVTGSVVDAQTQRPLSGVQIFVAGTQRGTLTNQQGRFLIPNVPAGPQQVRATLIGYSQATETVNVASGSTANIDFTLQQSAVELDAVIVSAVTGQAERRRELGNSVSSINTADVELAAVTSISQVLTARSPSVVVQQASGTSGTSSKIRIRGSNSISLNNQPLLVIDGVMVNANATGLNSQDARAVWVGGQETSRWNDISPEQIESMEIIKGPAAAALYGTAGANGVIQITTRRGRAGRTQWSAFVEQGSVALNNVDFPANFQQIGRNPTTGARVASCNIDAQSRGVCVPVADSLLSHSPLESDSPFRDGWRTMYGVNASGGNEGVTYFIGGDFEREQGVLEPNKVRKVNLRANLGARLAENLNAQITTGYVTNRVELPFGDNDATGAMGAGLLGSAVRDTVRFGYFSRHPSEFYFIEAGQETDRFTGGANLTWTPLAWLNVVAQAGLDQSDNQDFHLVEPGQTNYSTTLFEGYRRLNRVQYSTYTLNTSGTATYGIIPDLQGTTTVGTSYLEDQQRGSFAYGRQLLVGTGTLGGAGAGYAIDETAQSIITVGAFARQQFAWRDRLFVTASIRGDDNSAFGTDFGLVTYPAVSASWVVSDEPFFPELGVVNSLRLRAAYGQAGQRPGFRQATTYYSPVAVAIGPVERTAITLGGTGNVLLSPERTEEFETGFEVGMLDNRVGVEFTYYAKETRDQLIARRLAPSLGATNTQFANLGRVENSGVELLLNAQLLNRPEARWDATISASTNRSKILELGEGIEPIIFNSGGSQRHTWGFPAGGFFQREIVSFNDTNNDGVIGAGEIVLGDTATASQYIGPVYPTREIGFNTSVTLFDVLRVSGQLDYKGGHYQYNYTDYFRCANFQNCEDAHNPNSPHDRQAAYQAARLPVGASFAGYIEPSDFVKLRELAFTLSAPRAWAERFNAGALSLTIAGRNLATWTDYTGFDPEVNSTPYVRGGDYTTQDFLTLPPTRYWTARLNVNF